MLVAEQVIGWLGGVAQGGLQALTRLELGRLEARSLTPQVRLVHSAVFPGRMLRASSQMPATLGMKLRTTITCTN